MTTDAAPQRLSLWRRWRRSPRLVYQFVFVLFLTGVVWQGCEYWWGVHLARIIASNNGSVIRNRIFPQQWNSHVDPAYLHPFEPITHVTLAGRSEADGNRKVIADDLRAFKWVPFLKDLTIVNELTPEAWDALAELSQIRHLGLSVEIPDSAFPRVAKLKRLEELRLRMDATTSPSAIRQLVYLPDLQRLDLEIGTLPSSPPQFSSRVRPVSIAQQLRELAKSPSLFRLQANFPSDATLLAMTEMQSDGQPPLTNLRELRIDFSSISDEGLINLSNIPELVHLDLSHSEVTDKGIESLKRIPHLRTLYLAGCPQITDAGAEQLATMTGLQSLNIAETRMTNAGLMKLVALKKLRKLRLSTYHPVPQELKEKLPPQCVIDSR